MIDRHVTKIEEWVERSGGKVRADVIHERLVGMGFTGTERTTRRAVAEAKAAWRAGHRRTYRPWVTEPGLWQQFDWGEGDRQSTRLNSSHVAISYAVFCLKKKNSSGFV